LSLGRIGEVGFLEDLIRRHAGVMPPPPTGPGDDASSIGKLLFTADALIEGEHFRLGEPPFLLGRKSLAVNLSDIAAMGGSPRAFLLCLGLPPGSRDRWIRRLMDGIASMARETGTSWIGGDTVRSPRGVVISITVIGERGRSLLTRAGARAGDGIFVTGPLGGAAAGRALLEAGWSMGRGARAVSPRGPAAQRILRRNAELLRAQLDPAPRLGAGRFLADRGIASAAIDLSDGLSLDLHRLCRASGTGALIHREAIPVGQAARSWARAARRDPLDLALHGGEDYEILFTVPRRRERLLASWPLRDGTGPLLLGRIRARREGVRLADPDGGTLGLDAAGYDPFRRRHVDTL